jgi:lysophospholipase L1-like esterase
MTNFYENYVSNTLASTASQKMYFSSEELEFTSRVYYKVFVSGKFEYSFLYQDTIDGTFADGSESRANMFSGEWKILSAKVAVTDGLDAPAMDCANQIALTFGGNAEKSVSAREVFATDPVTLDVGEGQFVAIELTFKGKSFPHHPEVQISTYVKTESGWEDSVLTPLPSMVGIKRKPKLRVSFWGDSITQGIGAGKDSYLHYAAQTAEILGKEYSFWDIGIGYGRARDGASLGSWAERAKHCDVISVCFGVNDICWGTDADSVKKYLKTVVTFLKGEGKKVLLQSIPPFEYTKTLDVWLEVSDYVKRELAPLVDAYFDNVPVLCVSPKERNVPKYGGHPNAEGCTVWAQALAPVLKTLL